MASPTISPRTVSAGPAIRAQVSEWKGGEMRINHTDRNGCRKTYIVRVFDLQDHENELDATDQWKTVAKNVITYLDTLNQKPLDTLSPNPQANGRTKTVEVLLKAPDSPAAGGAPSTKESVVGVKWGNNTFSRAALAPDANTNKAEKKITKALSSVRNNSNPSASSSANLPSPLTPAHTSSPSSPASPSSSNASVNGSANASGASSSTTPAPNSPLPGPTTPAPISSPSQKEIELETNVLAFLENRDVDREQANKRRPAEIISKQLANLGVNASPETVKVPILGREIKIPGSSKTHNSLPLNLSPKELRQKAAEQIRDSENFFGVEDAKEIHGFLRLCYLHEQKKEGNFKRDVIDDVQFPLLIGEEYDTKLVPLLQQENPDLTGSDSESIEARKHLARAFANLISKREDLDTYPKVYFKAIYECLNPLPIKQTTSTTQTVSTQKRNLVIVQEDPVPFHGNKYTIWAKWGENIQPHNTIFIRGNLVPSQTFNPANGTQYLYALNSDGTYKNGTYSGFIRQKSTEPFTTPTAPLPRSTTPVHVDDEDDSAIIFDEEPDAVDIRETVSASRPPLSSSQPTLTTSAPPRSTTPVHVDDEDDSEIPFDEELGAVDMSASRSPISHSRIIDDEFTLDTDAPELLSPFSLPIASSSPQPLSPLDHSSVHVSSTPAAVPQPIPVTPASSAPISHPSSADVSAAPLLAVFRDLAVEGGHLFPDEDPVIDFSLTKNSLFGNAPTLGSNSSAPSTSLKQDNPNPTAKTTATNSSLSTTGPGVSTSSATPALSIATGSAARAPVSTQLAQTIPQAKALPPVASLTQRTLKESAAAKESSANYPYTIPILKDGNCAIAALLDARVQKQGQTGLTLEEQKDKKWQDQLQIRRRMFARAIKAPLSSMDEDFKYTLALDIREALPTMQARLLNARNLPSNLTEQTARNLLQRAPDLLKKIEEKKELNEQDKKDLPLLLSLYAWHVSGNSQYLDSSFFQWHATTRTTKIVVIQNNKVLRAFPRKSSQEPIDPNNCLFVQFNFESPQHSGHYQSVKRDDLELQEIVNAHNEGHHYLIARNAFLKVVADGEEKALTSRMLQDLKTSDPQGYRTICEMFGEDTVQKATIGDSDALRKLRKQIITEGPEDHKEFAKLIETEILKQA